MIRSLKRLGEEMRQLCVGLTWRLIALAVSFLVASALSYLAVNYSSAEPQQQATAPPGSGCPAYPAFPDSKCTGWRHTGVTLKAVPGQIESGLGWYVETVGGKQYLYITQDGAVLDALDINVCVKVFANNVTIKRSRIRCNDYYVVRVSDPPRSILYRPKAGRR